MLRNHANGDEAARKEYSGSGYRAAAAAARQWSAQAESRIVRVSRVFGGKDRHSKVKTVKGLRDRRVRLSVPTAIQLYDLQDRLGLSQPSKVVDWLLNAARDEIDKLPPLQFPPQDLVAHLPLPMPALSDDKFGVACRDDVAAAAASATPIKGDGVDGAHMGGYRFMSLNNSLGLASCAMPLAHHGAYCTGEPWNNVHESCGAGGAGSPEVAAHGHAPFPSLLSLAPGSHQLLFYSSDSGFGVKEAEHFTTVDHLGSHNLSLSSARAFHDHSGN